MDMDKLLRLRLSARWNYLFIRKPRELYLVIIARSSTVTVLAIKQVFDIYMGMI